MMFGVWKGGNGRLDGDEECDDGILSNRECTAECVNAICGDGFV